MNAVLLFDEYHGYHEDDYNDQLYFDLDTYNLCENHWSTAFPSAIIPQGNFKYLYCDCSDDIKKIIIHELRESLLNNVDHIIKTRVLFSELTVSEYHKSVNDTYNRFKYQKEAFNNAHKEYNLSFMDFIKKCDDIRILLYYYVNCCAYKNDKETIIYAMNNGYNNILGKFDTKYNVNSWLYDILKNIKHYFVAPNKRKESNKEGCETYSGTVINIKNSIYYNKIQKTIHIKIDNIAKPVSLYVQNVSENVIPGSRIKFCGKLNATKYDYDYISKGKIIE